MSRAPDGLTAKTVKTSVRWTTSTAAALDRIRGTIPRSRYLEKLVIEEDRRRREGSK